MRIARQTSAGGVVYRRRRGRTEVVLISVGDPPRWQLPKGHLDRGETAEDAAVREVREETNVEAKLLEPLGEYVLWFQARTPGGERRLHRKRVRHFLMQALTGDVHGDPREVNEARWFEIGEGIDALTFRNDQDVMRKARDRIDALHRRRIGRAAHPRRSARPRARA